eukprot:844469-Pelagomonas_calceolata.AAC.2
MGLVISHQKEALKGVTGVHVSGSIAAASIAAGVQGQAVQWKGMVEQPGKKGSHYADGQPIRACMLHGSACAHGKRGMCG